MKVNFRVNGCAIIVCILALLAFAIAVSARQKNIDREIDEISMQFGNMKSNIAQAQTEIEVLNSEPQTLTLK